MAQVPFSELPKLKDIEEKYLREEQKRFSANWEEQRKIAWQRLEADLIQRDILDAIQQVKQPGFGHGVYDPFADTYRYAQSQYKQAVFYGYHQREDLDPNEDKTYVAQTNTINFGKYAGTELSAVPKDYIDWLITSREKDIKVYKDELARRDLVENASTSTVELIIKEGYKAMAKKSHPDTGGSDKQFREVQAAFAQLKVVLEEVKRVTANATTTI